MNTARLALLYLFIASGCGGADDKTVDSGTTPTDLGCESGQQDNDEDGVCSDECAPDTCGANSLCDDSSGTATCSCEGGFQDNDNDGSCEAECDDNTCSGNGTCDDASGTPVCTCNPNYVGDDCASCDTNFQDNDTNGTCEDACAVDTCSGHGICSDTSGATDCTCDLGYIGDDCSICDLGFQDNNTDGTCEAECDNDTCSGNGICDDVTGTPTCTCNPEYALPDCASCAFGFQDNDTDGICTPACDANTCGGHGICDDNTGVSICTCDPGYAPPSCLFCTIDFQDNDVDGFCAPKCNANTCSGNGTCDDLSGLATCTCDPEYALPNCSTCRTGFQDNDIDGVCDVECALFTCSGHGVCDDSVGPATCTCEPGYGPPDCAECAPGFQDNDTNGTCTEACNPGTCAGYASCDDNTGVPVCTCDLGYVGPGCDACDDDYQDNDTNGTCTIACPLACTGFEDCDDNTGTATCDCKGTFTGGDCNICPAPLLIADDFADGDLATGGIGFSVFDNGNAGNGGAQEVAGAAEIFTADNSPIGEPMWTIVGSTPIDTTSAIDGLQFAFSVISADEPAFQGIHFGIQNNAGDAYALAAGRPWAGVKIGGLSGVEFQVIDAGGSSTNLSTEGYTYDVAALNDGFYLLIEMDDLGWTYIALGLLDNGGSLSESGPWPPGLAPADLFDNADYVTAGIQGDNADNAARLLVIEDITILDGTCAL